MHYSQCFKRWKCFLFVFFSESTFNMSTMKMQCVHLYSVEHFIPLLLSTFFVQRAIYASLFLLTGSVKQSIPSARGVFQCATNLKDCSQLLWSKKKIVFAFPPHLIVPLICMTQPRHCSRSWLHSIEQTISLPSNSLKFSFNALPSTQQ